MKFYDITLPLSKDLASWPGDTKFQRTETKTTSINSKLVMSAHSGTHIDAPKHFLFKGPGVDAVDPNALVGIYKVFQIKDSTHITVEEIRKFDIQKGGRVLFKTRNSNIVTNKKFTTDYVSLTPGAASYLVSKKVLLVGNDYFGLEAKSAPGHPVHKTLLAAGIVMVEGLYLKNVKAGAYDGAILPLKIKDGDGSPARAILWKH